MSETKAFKLINTFLSLLHKEIFFLKIHPQPIFNAVFLHINVPNKAEELSCHLYLRICPSSHFEAWDREGEERGLGVWYLGSFPIGRADGNKNIGVRDTGKKYRWDLS